MKKVEAEAPGYCRLSLRDRCSTSRRCPPPTRAGRFVALLALLLWFAPPAPGQNGVATHDDLLMGFHFNQFPRYAPATELNTELTFEEVTDWLPEDLPYLTYADFWVVWSDIERFKGDERGLANLDRAVNRALALGLKVKLVLIHSTWWAHDLDWSQRQILAIGPDTLEDWAHWCQVMATHFRGRVAQYDLQGEANGRDYWPFEKPAEIAAHVQDSFRVGCRAIRQVAPEALIGVSCATPGVGQINIYDQKINRAELDRWYRDNLTACKGLFDCAPINYFADVPWADPYGGGFAFYQSIRQMLDGLGLPQVELGSGESSINWADSSYDLKKYGLSIPAQARRLNDTFGATFNAGMNKWILHGLAQPPGFGWTWRWGFRKYEDFWGVWPEGNKVPGTRIVWRYDNPDGRKVDYRPAFARPADPHLPSWEIWKFWAQAAPRHAGGRRLPLQLSGGDANLWGLGSFLSRRDEAVGLIYSEKGAPVRLKLNVAAAGWPDGTELAAEARNESISFETGDHREHWRKDGLRTTVKDGVAALELPAAPGWTTVNLRPSKPAFAAELAGVVFPAKAQAGNLVRGSVLLRNTGPAKWPKGARVSLHLWPGNEAQAGAGLEVQPLAGTVRPGECGCFEVALSPVEQSHSRPGPCARSAPGSAPPARSPSARLLTSPARFSIAPGPANSPPAASWAISA